MNMRTYTYDYTMSYDGQVVDKNVFSFYGELNETHEAHDSKIRELINDIKDEFIKDNNLNLADKQHIIIYVERIY